MFLCILNEFNPGSGREGKMSWVSLNFPEVYVADTREVVSSQKGSFRPPIRELQFTSCP